MIVNLIKPQQMYSLTLPDKVKGQYWLTDTDDAGKPRKLFSIEARQGEWIVKSRKDVWVLNAENQMVPYIVLKPMSFFNLKIHGSNERIILFAESIDPSRQTFHKVVIRTPDTLTIGRTNDNTLCFENKFVSGKHARLSYDGDGWTLADQGSTNGTYVNGFRVKEKALKAGDLVYIMGLKIVIGRNYLAINNPDNLLHIYTKSLSPYVAQTLRQQEGISDIPEKEFFFRSPRFYREVEHAEIKIDPPPQLQKMDTVPLALMLGPSLTMGLTSLSTGILSLNNVIAGNGEITQALPTLMMSVSMLLGTVLWPILTKRYEKKQRILTEKKRQEKYLAYLDRVRDEIKRKCKEQSDIMQENLISPEACAQRIEECRPNLWERVIGQSDFLRLRLGIGSLPLDADVRYAEKKFSMEDDTLQDAMLSLGTESKQLTNVPISISLVDNMIVGLYGGMNAVRNMVKSLVLQIVALHSYDEVKLLLITDSSDQDEWEFVRPIPHFWSDDKSIRFFSSTADEVKELSAFMEKSIIGREDGGSRSYADYMPYYVVISTSKKLTEGCESMQQMLKYKTNRGFSILLAEPELKDLPKECSLVVSVDGQHSRMFDRDDTAGKALSFAADRVNELALNELSAPLANIELDLGGKHYALPSMITFLEMFDVGKIGHLNSLTRWKENNPTISLQTPVGVDSYGGLFNLDLHEKYHGPHGLVAGMTGSGKSEFIITYILSLAVNYHPDEVAFILIDYKGGGLTGAFEDTERGIKLPHLAGTITNLDGAAVKRSLISIQSELRRRQAIFNEARRVSNEGTMDIYKYQQLYRDKIVSEPVPHLFIISDEFAELKAQQPEFMEQLISAARIGRSLGVHLILATQKPSGVVDDQIWSNSKFRVCLKVQEKADSQDMIKCADAAELSQTGRFYLQVGFNELFALGQSAWCGAEYIPSDTVAKKVDSSVQVVDNLGRVIMNVKPNEKRESSGTKIKQVVAVVKYLSDLAAEEHISVRPLWLDPIPSFIYVDALEKKYGIRESGFVLDPVVGEYDDPFNQKQGVLTIPLSAEGNCMVYGSTGNGKTTFLTSLCYALLKNHTADELNLYILDFGSETLRIFERAPQVGGVAVSADEEKVVNLLKMLQQEIERRKTLFSEFGGDFASYCANSGRTEPNIVVALNNYSGFAEQFEDLQEMFSLLTRDGVKYGVYFVVTANGVNAVRYKTQQNFRRLLTMQLNDSTDYSVVVGKTEGLVPSKCKGRGLVALDRVYEFQTAYCHETADMQEFLRTFCAQLRDHAGSFARPIPVLPAVVNAACVLESMNGLDTVPVGISRRSLQALTVNLRSRVIYPVVTQELYEALPFVEELVRVLSSAVPPVVLDAGQLLPEDISGTYVGDDFEGLVRSLFDETVKRHNTYVDAQMSSAALDGFDERIYVIVGVKRLLDQLTADGKDKLQLLLEKAEAIFGLHYVLIETVSGYSSVSYDSWYKRHITGGDGIWIGDGVTDQYVLKPTKVTSDLYEELDSDFGYLFIRNRPVLVKLLSSAEEVE